jgi:predicted ArsR family transcriptional regulator
MNRSGRNRDVSNYELLVAGREVPEPVFTSTEVGERVGMSQQGVDKRLRKLETDGLLCTALKGSSRIWWLSYRGQKLVDEG